MMAGPLCTCTKEYQRSVIRDRWRYYTRNKENEQGMVSFLITKTQEVLDAATCREDYAESLLGQIRCTLGALYASGEHCALYSDLLKNDLRPAVRSKRRGFWLEVSLCNMTILGPILPVQQLQKSKTCTLSVFQIRQTRRTLPQVITICLGHSKRRWEEQCSVLMKRYSRRCMSGYTENYKNFFLEESEHSVQHWRPCTEWNGDYLENWNSCV
jgi:hypothetical protein